MRADTPPEISQEFRYFLHAWRRDPGSGLERCNELFGTDGERVRSMRSRGTFLTFEQVEEARAVRKIVDTVEREWEPETPFMGYESLADQSRVAILRQRGEEGTRWAVFPCQRESFPSRIPSKPADLDADGYRVHVVGGADVGWRHGEPVVHGALEVRSWGDTSLARQTGLLEEIEAVELRAASVRGKEPEEVGLAPRAERSATPERTGEVRAEFEFPLETVVYRTYREKPEFCTWFVVEYSADLFGLPETWRRFWMTVNVGDHGEPTSP